MVTRLRVSPESVASRLTIALSPRKSSRVDHVRERLRIKNSIRTGSVGLKVGLICEGQAHVYLSTSSRTQVWDACAPAAILREAGGRMADMSGKPLRYDQIEIRNVNGLIATNGNIQARVVSVVES